MKSAEISAGQTAVLITTLLDKGTLSASRMEFEQGDPFHTTKP
jgi:hypothetical protein